MRLLLLGSLIAVLACGGDDEEMLDGGDGSVPDGSTTQCRSNSICDDGLYCNGFETCDSSDARADARGCVAGDPPCDADVCVEDRDLCDLCEDRDGDGHDAMSCGGDDCDDDDPNRYPSNMEFCDADGVDEDCNPETFGFRDNDGDGVSDAMCCNGTVCGRDCDDSQRLSGPGGVEICDGSDNDCDGTVDEGFESLSYYPDTDGDGYGDADAEEMISCTPIERFASNNLDCDDEDSGLNPDAFDVCDGSIDQDCDGDFDNPPGGCDCVSGEVRDCALNAGVCSGATQTCTDGSWEECSIIGSSETCNDIDDDCDGETDEDVAVATWFPDEDGDDFGDSDASITICGRPPPGYIDAGGDCDDDDDDVYPGQTAYFPRARSDRSFDYNCDRRETPRYPVVSCRFVESECVYREGFIVTDPRRNVACGASGQLSERCERRGRSCAPARPLFPTRTTQTCR